MMPRTFGRRPYVAKHRTSWAEIIKDVVSFGVIATSIPALLLFVGVL